MSSSPRPRVAIVGAGPAGAYTAMRLLEVCSEVDIDLLERLPTPWGLLRSGVAPDHQEVKSLQQKFERETLGSGCRFIGNLEVGKDVSHLELMQHYSAVFYATGAQGDRLLGVPGENLPGSSSAREFVAWYSGHPDYCDANFNLSSERAVVVGNGNVAADVARMLMSDPADLARTDMAEHALEALSHHHIREVVVVGRRSAANAAFSNAALHELSTLKGVDLQVDDSVFDIDPASSAWLSESAGFTQRRNVTLLRRLAKRPSTSNERRIVLRFLRSPARIWGDGQVEGIDLRPNEMFRADDGSLRARMLAAPEEKIECGLVLRSVGFGGIRVPDLPFDERHEVVPNERGRVLGVDGATLPGTYTVGWIKRGPTGVLGSNKLDAQESVNSFMEDWNARVLPHPMKRLRDFDALLAERKLDIVTVDGWRAIDAEELARGVCQQRPRAKLTSTHGLLDAAGARGSSSRAG